MQNKMWGNEGSSPSPRFCFFPRPHNKGMRNGRTEKRSPHRARMSVRASKEASHVEWPNCLIRGESTQNLKPSQEKQPTKRKKGSLQRRHIYFDLRSTPRPKSTAH